MSSTTSNMEVTGVSTELTLPPAKRFCTGNTAVIFKAAADPKSQCLHCGSTFHTWSRCVGSCIHCRGGIHPRRRCPDLPLTNYMAPGFTILSDSSSDKIAEDPQHTVAAGDRKEGKPSISQIKWKTTAIKSAEAKPTEINGLPDAPPSSGFTFRAPIQQPLVRPLTENGISLERAAMIALTPEPSIPLPAAPSDPALGAQKTQANVIPLGKRKRRESGTQQDNAISAINTSFLTSGPATIDPQFLANGPVTIKPEFLVRESPPIKPEFLASYDQENNAVSRLQSSRVASSLRQSHATPASRWPVKDQNSAYSELCQHIYRIVGDCQSSEKAHNNGRDVAWVNTHIRQALSALKPTILRNNAPVPKKRK